VGQDTRFISHEVTFRGVHGHLFGHGLPEAESIQIEPRRTASIRPGMVVQFPAPLVQWLQDAVAWASRPTSELARRCQPRLSSTESRARRPTA
jgi:hypothetical protein